MDTDHPSRSKKPELLNRLRTKSKEALRRRPSKNPAGPPSTLRGMPQMPAAFLAITKKAKQDECTLDQRRASASMPDLGLLREYSPPPPSPKLPGLPASPRLMVPVSPQLNRSNSPTTTDSARSSMGIDSSPVSRNAGFSEVDLSSDEEEPRDDRAMDDFLQLYGIEEDEEGNGNAITGRHGEPDVRKSGDSYEEAIRIAMSESLRVPEPNAAATINNDQDTPYHPPKSPRPISDTRDQYGFRKQTQHISQAQFDDWNVEYMKRIAQRKKKWDVLLAESGLGNPGNGQAPTKFPPKSDKVKRYIRKGVPPEYRGACWFHYSGAAARMKKNPGLYRRMWQESKLKKSNDAEIIERDLHRTFPDNIYFKPESLADGPGHKRMPSKAPETPIIKALRRVLSAFANYVPRIGYCQSLNFIAGLFLLFMDEEKAFWMLVVTCTELLPGMHDVNLEGSNVDQAVLMLSIKENLPAIWTKIGGGLDGAEASDIVTKLPPITLVTAAWFMSAFIGVLPIESVLRVWDCLFYEGSKILFRIGLTVLKTGEAEILAVADPMEIFQVVQTLPKRMIDAGAVMEACFKRRNGFGHPSQRDVDQTRVMVRSKRQAAAVMNKPAASDDTTVGAGHGDFLPIRPRGLRAGSSLRNVRNRLVQRVAELG